MGIYIYIYGKQWIYSIGKNLVNALQTGSSIGESIMWTNISEYLF